jgi:uncharacterized protein YjbI with pentapeptide repeats
MPESPTLNLHKILASHARWLACDPSGQRANLDRASLLGANLDGANLEGANLEGANLNGASGIAIAADAPQRLSAAAAAALQEDALEMCTWHTCDTTHCWAAG